MGTRCVWNNEAMDQSYGSCAKTNPMGICCMYNAPILWGHDACNKEPDACTEDQSYGTAHVAKYTYA